MSRSGMRIGELANLLGTTTKTLRFYEGIGLLRPASRTDSAYRLYDQAAIDQARLVVGLRRLDLTIPELRTLLCDDREMSLRQGLLALMDDKLRNVYLQLSILQGRCDDLTARHAALLATPRDRPAQCICNAMLTPCHCGSRPGEDPK